MQNIDILKIPVHKVPIVVGSGKKVKHEQTF